MFWIPRWRQQNEESINCELFRWRFYQKLTDDAPAGVQIAGQVTGDKGLLKQRRKISSAL